MIIKSSFDISTIQNMIKYLCHKIKIDIFDPYNVLNKPVFAPRSRMSLWSCELCGQCCASAWWWRCSPNSTRGWRRTAGVCLCCCGRSRRRCVSWARPARRWSGTSRWRRSRSSSAFTRWRCSSASSTRASARSSRPRRDCSAWWRATSETWSAWRTAAGRDCRRSGTPPSRWVMMHILQNKAFLHWPSVIWKVPYCQNWKSLACFLGLGDM